MTTAIVAGAIILVGLWLIAGLVWAARRHRAGRRADAPLRTRRWPR